MEQKFESSQLGKEQGVHVNEKRRETERIEFGAGEIRGLKSQSGV